MSHPTLFARRGLVAAGAAAALVSGGAAVAATSPAAPPSALPAAPEIEDPTEVLRISGPDRYGTAAEIARAFPQDATGTVLIASGELFPDALSAQLPASMSGVAGGVAEPDVEGAGLPTPMLLTRQDQLPDATASALTDLAPSQIIVVGGEAAISEDVETELEGFGADVERISGEDRYDTSAELASLFPTGLPVLYLATGEDFPDALTGGARAGRDGVPMLLTDPDTLQDSTAEVIADLQPASVVVLGGSGAVSDDVVAAVTELVPDTSRVFGPDRYATAVALASSYEYDSVAYLASGENYPDALSGGAFAAYHEGPLLLSRPGGIPATTLAALDAMSPQGAVLFGGAAALDDDNVAAALDAALPAWVDEMVLQMLSFNDYHGHIEEEDGVLDPEQDPDQNLVGGAINLSATLDALRTRSFEEQTLTVAAGDLIGGSTFVSGLFQDEPSVETLEVAGLDISGVGNHEFDEGVEELLRMQNGGCHPERGCFEEEPYDGADFQWLAANVVDNETGEPILPATEVRSVEGVDVGFIGMTLEDTPTLVSPGGVSTVDFLDEVETANAQAASLREQGVESIVVLLHEGGYQTGVFNGCEGISGPVVEIAENLDPAIDAVVTGHTHQPYVCSIPDPAGADRLVTSANQYGRVVTETALTISRETGDVTRDRARADNHLVLQSITDDPEMVSVVDKWVARSAVLAGEVVGTVTEDITGDAGGDRGIETPMAGLVADSILWGTDGDDEGGAQISFMNVGGVRASLLVDQISNEEAPGEVTYQETYNVMPFGNILVSIDMTGEQIKAVLEQQYVPDRGRPYLALGVSEGFTYTWDDSQPEGGKVSDMQLDGVALEMDQTYRVSTLNFLQQGGDSFTAFTEGTDLVGGPEDLANLVDYLEANPDLSAPEDRVSGL
ncbi:cell wall-binding repeat-containing protein [Serinicoccus kebangsaanensis]|uniref:cell wall-binding repeat-containing protein n=1 Tax=Serinicoccus kebangsaanensis TaxID=2602069 RepID=UPI00124C3DD6|nr:cell wall-binding repeat-containing protein [Serinicoccus kebangsaanensis]